MLRSVPENLYQELNNQVARSKKRLRILLKYLLNLLLLMENRTSYWQLLSPVSAEALLPATRQLHYATQLIAALAKALLAKKEDDSHTNMEWFAGADALASNIVSGKESFRLALVFPDFTLQCWNAENQPIATFTLAGKTVGAAIDWIIESLQTHFAIELKKDALFKQLEIPENLSVSSNIFEPTEVSALQQLANYYHNSHFLIMDSVARFEYASTIRTWPHHFDIGSYIPLSFDAQQAPDKSIGIGLAIPDVVVDDFYFYITPWSKTDDLSAASLPSLPVGGYWNQQHWTGAVLKMSALNTLSTATAQLEAATIFLEAALSASERTLGTTRV